jgi:hypothetical protein
VRRNGKIKGISDMSAHGEVSLWIAELPFQSGEAGHDPKITTVDRLIDYLGDLIKFPTGG